MCMLAIKLRAPEPTESIVCEEYWISEIEPCGDDWMFSVIGPGEEPELFVYASEGAAECARARMFRALCPALSIASFQ